MSDIQLSGKDILNECILIVKILSNTPVDDTYYSKRANGFNLCASKIIDYLENNCEYNANRYIKSVNRTLDLFALCKFFALYSTACALELADKRPGYKPEIIFLRLLYFYEIEKVKECTNTMIELVESLPETARKRHPIYSDLDYFYQLLCVQQVTYPNSDPMHFAVRAGKFADCKYVWKQMIDELNEDRSSLGVYYYEKTHFMFYTSLLDLFDTYSNESKITNMNPMGYSSPEEKFKRDYIEIIKQKQNQNQNQN